MAVQTIIKHRRDTAATWLSVNPVLASGEIGLETDTGLKKIGNGTAAWDALAYEAVSRVVQAVKNSTGASISKGSAVYISGATGDNALVSLADADAESTSSKTLGLMETTVADEGFGNVITDGLISGVNTGTATAGQSVWLSSTAGQFVFGNPPAKPAHGVYLGVVIRAHSTEGEILVKVQNGYELNELHDVDAASPSTGDALVWDGSMWVNQQVDVSGAITTHNAETANVHGIADTSLLATKSYADNAAATAAAAVVDAAPATLDTLNELAAALGDDANFAATVTTALGTKAPIDSPTFTGTVGLPEGTVSLNTIQDGAIKNIKISDNANIAQSKIANLTTDLAAKQDVVAGVTSTEIGYLSNVTSDIQTQLDGVFNSPTITDPTLSISQTVSDTVYMYGFTAAQDASLLLIQRHANNQVPSILSVGSVFTVTGAGGNPGVSSIDGIQFTVTNLAVTPQSEGFYDSVLPISVSVPAGSESILAAWAASHDVINGGAEAYAYNVTLSVAAAATITPTEISYIDGVTSNIQEQINNAGSPIHPMFLIGGI